MDENRRIPVSLVVVAALFIFTGICAVIEVVVLLMQRHLSIHFGVLGLFIGPGLLGLRRGWLDVCARVPLDSNDWHSHRSYPLPWCLRPAGCQSVWAKGRACLKRAWFSYSCLVISTVFLAASSTHTKRCSSAFWSLDRLTNRRSGHE